MLQKLIKKADRNDGRFTVRYDPGNDDEPWGVKYYPAVDDDAHFFGYGNNLDAVIEKLLHEMENF